MLGKNIRHYRLMQKLSQEELAKAVGVGKMAISNYESGKRNPDYETTCRLAAELKVPLGQLMAQNDAGLVIRHGAFRKQSSLTKSQQEVIQGEADRYLGRLYEAVSFIGDFALPAAPEYERILANDFESAGQRLRQILGLSPSGPVGNITDILENRGFIICPVRFDARGFSGTGGLVNGRPFITVNTGMPAERQRFTLIHELAHLVFTFGEGQDEERMVDGIAGAFLLPEVDIRRELGPRRSDIRGDLRYIQREYSISMSSIVVRARQTGIITQEVFDITMRWMSARGLRTDEQSGIVPEETHLLAQLISRAVAEDEIGISKAAEMLGVSLPEARRLCYGGA